MSERDEQEVTRKSGMVYAAVFAIITSVVAFLLIGWALDRWLGTGPWLLVTGIIFGSVIGFIEFIRLISKVN